MKKVMQGIGALSFTVLMAGLPAAALAESYGLEGQDSVRANEQQGQGVEVSREHQLGTSSPARPSIQGGEDEQEIGSSLEEEEGAQATSAQALKQDIEARKHELDQEAASSTPDHRDIIENANPVRLAVHSLLASRDLLDAKGGIGQQVSEIAKEMNDSVASTTNAEAKIQSRGFLTRLFFGGDKTSAEVIAQVAAENQIRIDNLTALLSQASTTEAVKATLSEQITALKEAQTRLQALADKEKSAWGLFSWRF